ncbi:ThiF family adenylyltransferase [Kutzneria kofuensis]|uniref:ThiF family adenylyltransferase n=1 Tax=Kutzneria kofuensis TaxID=103725 RepID=UPI003CD07B7F
MRPRVPRDHGAGVRALADRARRAPSRCRSSSSPWSPACRHWSRTGRCRSSPTAGCCWSGAGSIGGAAAHALAAYGVGRLHLLDPDRLEWHNLPRHVCGEKHVGRFQGGRAA